MISNLHHRPGPSLHRSNSSPQLGASVKPRVETDDFLTYRDGLPYESIGGKAKAYSKMLKTDPDYRLGFLTTTVNQLGDGLANAGNLVLFSSLSSRLAGIALGAFSLVEIAIACATFIRSSHQRDNIEGRTRAGLPVAKLDQDAYRQLKRSALVDGAIAGLIASGVSVAKYTKVNPLVVLGAVMSVKALQAFNKMYENGAWNSLKYNLGNDQTKKLQLQMRSTITAFEMTIGLLNAAVALGMLLVLDKLQSIGTKGPIFALVSTLAGGALSFSVKHFFCHVCQKKSQVTPASQLRGEGLV